MRLMILLMAATMVYSLDYNGDPEAYDWVSYIALGTTSEDKQTRGDEAILILSKRMFSIKAQLKNGLSEQQWKIFEENEKTWHIYRQQMVNLLTTVETVMELKEGRGVIELVIQCKSRINEYKRIMTEIKAP